MMANERAFQLLEECQGEMDLNAMFIVVDLIHGG